MRTRRRFGQHFLEAAWVDKLIGVVAADASDTFIEIGAGRGALTRPLAARARHVVAIEVDRDLAAELSRSAPSNLRLIVGDVLETDLGELLGGLESMSKPARVAGNLPYNISTPIIFKLLSESREGRLISDATLMLQAEVADRLQAAPGSKEYGVLGILVRLGADVDRLLELPPGAFRPMPRVRSAVVRLSFRPPRVDVGEGGRFESLVRTIFSRRRKTLRNALRGFAPPGGSLAPEDLLAAAGVEPTRRPETLSMEELARLAQHFTSMR